MEAAGAALTGRMAQPTTVLYRKMASERQAPAERRFLVSTICRGSRPGEACGHLYVVDPERGVDSACPVPPPPHLHREPNPRGGIRGGRGLAACGDTVYVANGAGVLRFDRSWRLLAEIGHRWCGNVHDIAVRDDRLWVCSTANDALAAFDPAGRLADLIDLRPAALLAGDRSRFAAAADYRDPAGYRAAESDLLHANGIGFDAAGAPVVTLGLAAAAAPDRPRRGLIARADGRGAPVTVADGAAAPIHNVVPRADGTILTLDTGAGALRILSPDGAILSPDGAILPPDGAILPPDGAILPPDGTATASLTLAPPAPRGFLRGLCPAGGDRLLAGERNRLLIVDLSTAQIAGTVTLSASPREAVYAIAPLPAGFDPLPPCLTVA